MTILQQLEQSFELVKWHLKETDHLIDQEKPWDAMYEVTSAFRVLAYIGEELTKIEDEEKV